MLKLFEEVEDKEVFQTPDDTCEYMAGFLPDNCGTILEPTPGKGHLVRALAKKGTVIAPARFEDIAPGAHFDYVVMNPPFTPMSEGYKYLLAVMEMTDNIIALLPWFILINSENRLNYIHRWGLVSVTSLPRNTFPCCRIQCCTLEMKKGYQGDTKFHIFTGKVNLRKEVRNGQG